MLSIAALMMVILLISAGCSSSPGNAHDRQSDLVTTSQPIPGHTHKDQRSDLQSDPTITRRYVFDQNISFTDIVVRRGGRLKQLGHDHIVSLKAMDGFVIDAEPGANAVVRIDLRQIELDNPVARKSYSLDTEPDVTDIEATHKNLNEKVLEPDRYPEAWLFITTTDQTRRFMDVETHMVLKDIERVFPLSVAWVIENGTLTASGQFSILQSDFGIQPFSVLGGNLKVEDALEIYFSLSFSHVDSDA